MGEAVELETKPDFNRVRLMWEHFWSGEVHRRPLVVAAVRRPGGRPVGLGRRYHNAITGRHEEQMRRLDEWLQNTLFLAESVPYFGPDLGPDQFAARLDKLVENAEMDPTIVASPRDLSTADTRRLFEYAYEGKDIDF